MVLVSFLVLRENSHSLLVAAAAKWACLACGDRFCGEFSMRRFEEADRQKTPPTEREIKGLPHLAHKQLL